jgi:O-antigen ligase
MLLLLRGELPRASLAAAEQRWTWALIVAYLAPLASAVFAALLRQDFSPSQFDAPARFLLAIPIFLFVQRAGWPTARVVRAVLPLALGIVLLYLQTLGYDHKWEVVDGPRRVTTFRVDPLVFGYFSLAFGLMALVSIEPREWRDGHRWTAVLCLVALLLGICFSVRSGSRSGWLALPLVIGVWAHHHWGRRHRFAAAGVVAAALLLPVLAYLFVPPVGTRIDEAVKDVVEYPWHGVLRHETSLGYRITFLRMAADIVSQHPWAGIGDFQHAPMPPASAFPYASPDAVHFAFTSAFHNQIVSNAVRSGIGGLLAGVVLLCVPLLICARGLRGAAAPVARRDAMMGLAYCICVAVSSLSTEVVDLKFAASFYAVMTAVFCGAVLRRQGAGTGPG